MPEWAIVIINNFSACGHVQNGGIMWKDVTLRFVDMDFMATFEQVRNYA